MLAAESPMESALKYLSEVLGFVDSFAYTVSSEDLPPYLQRRSLSNGLSAGTERAKRVLPISPFSTARKGL